MSGGLETRLFNWHMDRAYSHMFPVFMYSGRNRVHRRQSNDTLLLG
jgi:hypothetical protein